MLSNVRDATGTVLRQALFCVQGTLRKTVSASEKELELSPSAIVNSEIRVPSAQVDVKLRIKDLWSHFQEVTF